MDSPPEVCTSARSRSAQEKVSMILRVAAPEAAEQAAIACSAISIARYVSFVKLSLPKFDRWSAAAQHFF
jgi:hypothetical protein